MSIEPVTIPADARPIVPIPAFRLISARISRELTTMELAAAELTSALDQERRGHEAALQEAGRLRARVEELEGILRDTLAAYPDAVLDEPDDWLWATREAMGLDGATGARDVNAEVAR